MRGRTAWHHALVVNERRLGLRRIVVGTSVGPVVVRVGRDGHVGHDGGDPATVLLHGAAGSWTTWTPLIEESDRGAHPLTDIVAIDLPGWGESSTTRRVREVATMSAVVEEVVRALGYTRWRLVGHSLGGFVALDIAARRPAETVSVHLVSPSGPAVIEAIRRPLRGLRVLPAFVGMLLIMRALAPFAARAARFVRALHAAGVLAPLSAPLFADRRRVDPSVIDALSREIRPRAFADAARAAAAYDSAAWRAVECPVRSVHGARDVFVAADDGIRLAALIADFRDDVAVETGHFGAIERPDLVLTALELDR